MKLTLDRLIKLVGSVSDGSRASRQLRSMLQEDSEFAHTDLEGFLEESRIGTESYHYRAFQDIVNSLGERLGFCAQYGTYAGNTSPIPYDGLWFTDEFEAEVTYMVIETKKSVDPPGAPEQQLGGYIDRLCDQWDLDRCDVFGLIVADKGDLRSVVNDIRDSDYDGRIRTISVHRLLSLLKLKRKYVVTHRQAAELLFSPDVIDLNALVDLAGDFTDRVDFWRRVQHETGIYRNDTTIKFNEDYNHKENFERFVEFMFKDGLMRRSDLPVTVGNARYIHTKPMKASGKPMNAPAEVVDGIYLDTAFEKNKKKSFMERLALEYAIERY